MTFCSVFIVSFVSISYSVFFDGKVFLGVYRGGVQGQLCFRPDLRNRALRTAIWMFWFKIRTNVVIQTKDAIFSKKHFFHKKCRFLRRKAVFCPFFWKKGNFSKKIASWKKPKETKKHKRPRTQSRIQTPF